MVGQPVFTFSPRVPLEVDPPVKGRSNCVAKHREEPEESPSMDSARYNSSSIARRNHPRWLTLEGLHDRSFTGSDVRGITLDNTTG